MRVNYLSPEMFFLQKLAMQGVKKTRALLKSLLMAKLAKFLFLREKRCNLVPSKLQNNEYNHSRLAGLKKNPMKKKYREHANLGHSKNLCCKHDTPLYKVLTLE